MRQNKKALIIGIAGGTGSGKTTISKAIIDELPSGKVSYVQHDSYYRDRPELSFDERAALNFDHPDSLDNDLLASHLKALADGEAIQSPSYDFVTHRRLPETTLVSAAAVVVVEGILIFSEPKLRDLMDIKLYIDTPADIRILRRLRRDIEQRGRVFEDVRKQYYETVRPMHEAFVEPSRLHADLIIPEGGNRQVAIEVIVERVRRQLES